MEESDVMNLIRSLGEKLPRFDDGRIDYTTSDTAPVVTVFIRHRDKFLLLKRSDKVLAYKGLWNTVAGYLDEIKPVKKKALEEAQVEVGIEEKNVSEIKIGAPYDLEDKKINKIWRICPVLLVLKAQPDIRLDYESTEYKWIYPKEIKNFETVPGLDKGLALFIKL